MTKAMFGIVTSLALVVSPAWADDEPSVEQAAASDAVAKAQIKPEAGIVGDDSSAPAVDAGRDTAAMKESDAARASFEERWLREREGYRDGGY